MSNYRLTGDYGEYFIDLMYYLAKSGAKIAEIGYVNYSRTSGVSKTATNWRGFGRRGIKYIIVLVKLWLRKSFFR